MDKLHLIKRIAERCTRPLDTKGAEDAVRVILDALGGTLAKGGRIEIRGFGSFSLKQLPPKPRRSPKTGFQIREPAKYIPCFKPAKELRLRTNHTNGAAIAEVSRPLPMLPELLDHDAVNDTVQPAIYAEGKRRLTA
jgi:integration host factor subunit beta